MQERKALMAEKNAFNFSMLSALVDEDLPAIVVAIDNYDVIRELGVELEDFWTKLTRDGGGLGIYVVASATRAGAFKYVVLGNFKSRVAHHMIDQSEAVTVVGRTPYSLSEQPGRAFIKYDGINVMQVYTPLPIEDELSYAQGITALVDRIKDSYSGAAVEGLRVLPEVLTYALLRQFAGPGQAGYIPIGLDFQEVQVQSLSLSQPTHLILGTAGSGKTNVLRVLLEGLGSAEKVLLVDSKEMELGGWAGRDNVLYCANSEQMKVLISSLRETVEERKEKFAGQSGVTPRQFYASLPSDCILIGAFGKFVELLKGRGASDAEALIRESMATGVCFVATSLSSRMKGFDELSKVFKETTSGLILGSPIAQTVWQVPTVGYKPRPDSALLYNKGEAAPVKVPLVEGAE